MRRILVERARRRGRVKHGAGRRRVPIRVADLAGEETCGELLVLDEALPRMEEEDERMARVVMLRFFAGLSVEATANALGISAMTVKRDWGFARAWLYQQVYGEQ